jgi:PAP2 superfamily
MTMSVRFRATVSRCFGVHAEAAILVAVLLAWQAARIPLEGSVDASLAHARTWHDLEGALGLAGLENAIVSAVYDPDVIHVARWGYSNLHLFAIVAFMLAIRTRAPDRYPPLRNAFVLLHLPALVVIGLWPLASPSWLRHPPEWPGNPPTDPELTGSLEATLRNSTAAAVSEHFGYTVLILAAALWIAPRAPLAWLLALYPPARAPHHRRHRPSLGPRRDRRDADRRRRLRRRLVASPEPRATPAPLPSRRPARSRSPSATRLPSTSQTHCRPRGCRSRTRRRPRSASRF